MLTIKKKMKLENFGSNTVLYLDILMDKWIFNASLQVL